MAHLQRWGSDRSVAHTPAPPRPLGLGSKCRTLEDDSRHAGIATAGVVHSDLHKADERGRVGQRRKGLLAFSLRGGEFKYRGSTGPPLRGP